MIQNVPLPTVGLAFLVASDVRFLKLNDEFTRMVWGHRYLFVRSPFERPHYVRNEIARRRMCGGGPQPPPFLKTRFLFPRGGSARGRVRQSCPRGRPGGAGFPPPKPPKKN